MWKNRFPHRFANLKRAACILFTRTISGETSMARAKRGSTSTAAAGAAKDKKARKSPAPTAADGVDPDYGLIEEYIAEWVASERAKLLAPTEEEERAIEDLKQKRLGAANGTKEANGGHIETDHGLVDALWQKCKEHLPEELAYYLDVECASHRQAARASAQRLGRRSRGRLAAAPPADAPPGPDERAEVHDCPRVGEHSDESSDEEY
jgi:hypothetical protein